jgi:hypothetical protein
MSQEIRKAFEVALAAMLPALPTVYENRNPPAGFDATKPHQKCWLLPAENRSLGLKQKTTLQTGTFQVNLCYPSGIGTVDANQRAAALQTTFYAGRELVADGVRVRVKGKPSIAAASSLSPYTVPVSIRYESYN